MISARTFTIMILVYTATLMLAFGIGLGSAGMVPALALAWASWGRAYALGFRGFDVPESKATEQTVWGRNGAANE